MGQGVLFQVICVWFPRDSLEMGPRAGARGTKGKKEKTLGPQTSYSIRNAQLHNDFWPPLLGHHSLCLLSAGREESEACLPP